MLFDSPAASVTVSVTMYVPGVAHVVRTVGRSFVSERPSPQFHRYDTILRSSVDVDASSVHWSVGQVQVKAAVGA